VKPGPPPLELGQTRSSRPTRPASTGRFCATSLRLSVDERFLPPDASCSEGRRAPEGRTRSEGATGGRDLPDSSPFSPARRSTTSSWEGWPPSLTARPVFTMDVDVVYSRAHANVERLATALSGHAPYLRGAPPGLAVPVGRRHHRARTHSTLTTDLGPLVLLGEIPGGGTFEDLKPEAVTLRVFGVDCLCSRFSSQSAPSARAGRRRNLEANRRARSAPGGVASLRAGCRAPYRSSEPDQRQRSKGGRRSGQMGETGPRVGDRERPVESRFSTRRVDGAPVCWAPRSRALEAAGEYFGRSRRRPSCAGAAPAFARPSRRRRRRRTLSVELQTDRPLPVRRLLFLCRHLPQEFFSPSRVSFPPAPARGGEERRRPGMSRLPQRAAPLPGAIARACRRGPFRRKSGGRAWRSSLRKNRVRGRRSSAPVVFRRADLRVDVEPEEDRRIVVVRPLRPTPTRPALGEDLHLGAVSARAARGVRSRRRSGRPFRPPARGSPAACEGRPGGSRPPELRHPLVDPEDEPSIGFW